MTTSELHVPTKEGMQEVGGLVGGSITVTDGHSNVQLHAIKKHMAGSKKGATLLLYPGEGGTRFEFRPCYA